MSRPYVSPHGHGQFSKEHRSHSFCDTTPPRHFPPRRTTSSGNFRLHDSSSGNGREFGVVERLMGTYGFIALHDRRDRIFFHMSCVERPDDVKTGAEVEFSVDTDGRTGKPIATNIKISPANSSGSFEPMDDRRYQGVIECEPKARLRRTRSSPSPNKLISSIGDMGQISCRENGESFFIPFSLDSIQDRRAHPHADDQVSFTIFIERRSGRKEARDIQIVETATPTPTSSSSSTPLKKQAAASPSGRVCRGVIKDLRERFGFIERADLQSRQRTHRDQRGPPSDQQPNIFFHFSEIQNGDACIGDSVEFVIQEQSDGRLCACNVELLPSGTVQVEDIDRSERLGIITEGLDSARKLDEGSQGWLRFKVNGRTEELPFSDRNFDGCFSLLPGDHVRFRCCQDLRSGKAKAVEVSLEKLSAEPAREQGIVCALKEAQNYGFVRCVDKDDARVFFHFNEILNTRYKPDIGDELEFSVTEGQGPQQRAIRVTRLPPGSVELVHEDLQQGLVQSTPRLCSRPSRLSGPKEAFEREMEPGVICYDRTLCVSYMERDCTDPKAPPCPGDEVVFYVCENRTTGKKHAVKVSVVRAAEVVSSKGYVVALKHSFGFVESANHREQLYFHFRAVERECPDLSLKDEVSFIIAHRGGRTYAENIMKLEPGSLDLEVTCDDQLEGIILRPTQDAESESTTYEGLIEVTSDGLASMTNINVDGCPYRGAVVALAESTKATTGILCVPFTVYSLADCRNVPQKGDRVVFSLSVTKASKECRAVEVKAKQAMYRGAVDSLKDGFGFIVCEDGRFSGESVFFHMSEVEPKENEEEIQVGDLVEFVIIHNQKRGKPQACNVRHVSAQRPDRLAMRLEGVDTGPRMAVRRQPYQPDGTTGFSTPRRKHICGEYVEHTAEASQSSEDGADN